MQLLDQKNDLDTKFNMKCKENEALMTKHDQEVKRANDLQIELDDLWNENDLDKAK